MKIISAFTLALHLGAFRCNCQDVRKRSTSRHILLGKGKTGYPSNYPTQEPSVTSLKKKEKKVSSTPSVSTSSPSVTWSTKPSISPTRKSNYPSRTKSSLPTLYSNSVLPSQYPTFKPSFLNSPNPSVAPTIESSTPTNAPVSSSINPTQHEEPVTISASPSSSATSQISQKPSHGVITHFPSSPPVESNSPYPSYHPSTNINQNLCEIRNMTIGNTFGNSVVIKYSYEMIYNSTNNITGLMSNVEQSVMNGLLPIVDSCEGVRLTSNTIVGISGEPDDTILSDSCTSGNEFYACSRIEARMTFFFTDSGNFNALDILDRIKTILDGEDVEGINKEIIILRYVTNELVGGSGPMSETDNDTSQQKSDDKVPVYAWLLIAAGGFVGLGIVGNRLQRNLKKYREVDSIVSNHAIE